MKYKRFILCHLILFNILSFNSQGTDSFQDVICITLYSQTTIHLIHKPLRGFLGVNIWGEKEGWKSLHVLPYN